MIWILRVNRLWEIKRIGGFTQRTEKQWWFRARHSLDQGIHQFNLSIVFEKEGRRK